MITLKYWNSLSNSCRQHILNIVTNNGTYADRLIEEYHHGFDFDGYGKILKQYLSNCYLTKDNKIKITVEVQPVFSAPKKKVIKTKKAEDKPTMHRYYFRAYRADDEDGENLWADAYSEEEARNQIYDDNWGIETLDLIRKE